MRTVQRSECLTMAKFDFIQEESYRASLEGAYGELERALEIEAWHAAILLAGGLFETLLTLFLVSRNVEQKHGIDPIKLPVDKSMALCVKENLRIAGTAEAKKLVLMYRKLIHPNATIRLSQGAAESDANAALSLVQKLLERINSNGSILDAIEDISFDELQKALGNPTGPGAKETLDVIIRRNLRGGAIVDELKTLSEDEIVRMVKVVIPLTAGALGGDKKTLDEVEKTAALLTLRDVYRLALPMLPEDKQKEALAEQLTPLATEDKSKAVAFIDYLFQTEDFKRIEPEQAGVLKKLIFQRMEKAQNRFFLESILNIWYYLTKDEIDEFTNICLSCVIYGSTQDIRIETKSWLNRTNWEEMSDELRGFILSPLNRWIENYEFFNDVSHANIVRELRIMAERKK